MYLSSTAREATGALIDRMIKGGVQRFSAGIDPDNPASARVLERLGFRYEGRSVRAWFKGDGPDAPVGDDVQFGMTADDRRAWLERPTGPPAEVRLVEIDAGSQRRVGELRTHWSQRNMVAPVEASYGDALFPPTIDGTPVRPRLRAIEILDDPAADGYRPAGFLMLAVPPEPGDREPYLWRMLIDRADQGRGIGARALDQVEDGLRRDGHRSMTVHWVEGIGSPAGFYRGRGYVPTGRVQDGEIEGRLILAG